MPGVYDLYFEWRDATGRPMTGMGRRVLSEVTREEAIRRAAREAWTSRSCVFYIVSGPRGDVATFRGRERNGPKPETETE